MSSSAADFEAQSLQQSGGIWQRVGAHVVDCVILFCMYFPVSLLFVCLFSGVTTHLIPQLIEGVSPVDRASAFANGISLITSIFVLAFLASLVICLFYYGWFYKHKGATIGKRLFGLRLVVHRTGKNVGYIRSLFRDVLWKQYLFNFFLWPWMDSDSVGIMGAWGTIAVGCVVLFVLSFMLAAIRSDRRAVHDLFFGTVVLRSR